MLLMLKGSVDISLSEVLKELVAKDLEIEELRMLAGSLEQQNKELLAEMKGFKAQAESLQQKVNAAKEDNTAAQLRLEELEAELLAANERERERKREVRRLKNKLRERQACEGDWVSMFAQRLSTQEQLKRQIVHLQAQASNQSQGQRSPPDDAISSSLKALVSPKHARKVADIKDADMDKGREKMEIEVSKDNGKKRDKGERRSFVEKINKLKKERDQFAADAAALQVECESLINHVGVS